MKKQIQKSPNLSEKEVFFVLSPAWEKKSIWVNGWHASCIPLRSTMSIASCFINRRRKMESFEERWKVLKSVMNRERCYFVLSRAWVIENTVSSHGESNLRSSHSAIRCSTIEPQRLYGEYASYILLRSATSRTSCFINRIRKMITFAWMRETFQELGKGRAS